MYTPRPMEWFLDISGPPGSPWEHKQGTVLWNAPSRWLHHSEAPGADDCRCLQKNLGNGELQSYFHDSEEDKGEITKDWATTDSSHLMTSIWFAQSWWYLMSCWFWKIYCSHCSQIDSQIVLVFSRYNLHVSSKQILFAKVLASKKMRANATRAMRQKLKWPWALPCQRLKLEHLQDAKAYESIWKHTRPPPGQNWLFAKVSNVRCWRSLSQHARTLNAHRHSLTLVACQ